MTATQELITENKCTLCTTPLKPHEQIMCNHCWEDMKEASNEEEDFQRELRCTD